MVNRMPNPIPEPILSRAVAPPSNGRPVRKDEIELHDRGIYIESWLPERRSRRKPLLFIHGELAGSWVWERYLGYFAGRGWEGHALNLRNHYWSQTADPATLSFETYTEDVVAALDRLGPTTVAVGHGMGALLALKAAERVAISGLVLLAPGLPRDLRPPARPHELREIPEVYGRNVIGWETLPEKLLRDDRDLTLADVLQDPAPARPEAARGRRGPAPGAGRRAGRPAGRGGGAASRHRRRAGPDRSASTRPSGSPSGWAPSTSRSGRIRTSASWPASRATSRSPRRSACSSRRTALGDPAAAAVEASRGSLVSFGPATAVHRRRLCAAFV